MRERTNPPRPVRVKGRMELEPGWCPSAEGGDAGWYALVEYPSSATLTGSRVVALISCDDRKDLEEICERLGVTPPEGEE